MIAVGHHDRSPDYRYLAVRRELMDVNVAFRNFGCAALQLAHVAEGRIDAYVELELSAWDAMAGLLLVDEAGGWTGPFPGPGGLTVRAPVIASARGLGAPLARIVARRYFLTLAKSPASATAKPSARTYLRSAALTCAAVSASSARVELGGLRQVRPRYACVISAAHQDAVVRCAFSRRFCITACFASATSLSVNPSFTARAISSGMPSLHALEVLRREDRVDEDRAVVVERRGARSPSRPHTTGPPSRGRGRECGPAGPSPRIWSATSIAA